MSKRISISSTIDPHVHARDMNQESVMTIMQTCIEAKKSGTDTVCLMPNTNPSIDNPGALERYKNLMKEAETATGIKCFIWIALTDENHKSVIHMLNDPYVVGVKIYPLKDDGSSVTTGAVGIKKFTSLMKLLAMMRRNEIYKPIAGHWEDPKLGHGIDSEVAALKKLVLTAESYPEFSFTACHLTTAEGLKIVSNAQQNGTKIMIEFTPHHLWFCNEEVDTNNGLYKCFPPIKSCTDRKALRDFIKNNKNNHLVSIGSDTAPHNIADKEKENPNGGLATQQHIIPILLSLQKELELTKKDIENLTSINIANFLNIEKPKGISQWDLSWGPDKRYYNNNKVLNPFKDEVLIGKKIS